MDGLRIEPVTGGNVGDLDDLFARGDPRTCQCTWMRFTNADYRVLDTAAKRAAHQEAVRAAEADGRAAGLIAYRDERVVGWVSFDDRTSFGRVVDSRLLRPADHRPAWSIVCFVVAPSERGRGLAGVLLDRAVDYAAEHGASLLEAYPVEHGPDSPAASLWHGTVSMFERSGFTTVDVRRHNRTSKPRPIMQRNLS